MHQKRFLVGNGLLCNECGQVRCEALVRDLGLRTGDVGNYGMSGAHAAESALVLRRLLDKEPEVIIWLVSPRELARRSRPTPAELYLVRFEDWLEEERKLNNVGWQMLSAAVKNHLSEYSLLMRYRPKVRELLRDNVSEGVSDNMLELIRPSHTKESPMLGTYTPWQAGADKNRSINVGKKRVRRYLGARYGSSWPDGFQIRQMTLAGREARARGVPLLFAELPLHPLLQSEMPESTMEEFRNIIHLVAEESGSEFIPLSRTGRKFSRGEFREQSHLNYRGAKKAVLLT